MLYLVVENEEVHANLCKPALEKFYKRWNRCLTTMPKILLGENIVQNTKPAWQGIYFTEFDPPRSRKYYVKVVSA